MGQIQGSSVLMTMSIHWEYLLQVSASCHSGLYVYPPILESPALPLSIPPLRHISYVYSGVS